MSQLNFVIYLISMVLINAVTSTSVINVAEREAIKGGFITQLSSTMEFDEKMENLTFEFDEKLSALCGSNEMQCKNWTGVYRRLVKLINDQYLIVRTYKDSEMMQPWCKSLYDNKELIHQTNMLTNLQSVISALVSKKFQYDAAELEKKRKITRCKDLANFKDQNYYPFFLNFMLVEMKLMSTMMYTAWEMAPLMINATEAAADELTYGWESHAERVKAYANHPSHGLNELNSEKLRSCSKSSADEADNFMLIRNILQRYTSDWMNFKKGNALMRTIIKSQSKV